MTVFRAVTEEAKELTTSRIRTARDRTSPFGEELSRRPAE